MRASKPCQWLQAGLAFAVGVIALIQGASPGFAQLVLTPGVDYTKPNFAYSPPIRKFVDSLPGLTVAGTNGVGQYIPVAVANTPYGSPWGTNCQYYEIGLVEPKKSS